MPRYRVKGNGKNQSVNVDADTPLLYVLRDDLALKGPKFGCGLGQRWSNARGLSCPGLAGKRRLRDWC